MSHKRSQIFWHQEAFHSQTSDVRTASRLLRGHTFLASIQNETLVGDVGSEQLTVHMRHLFKQCRLASHRVQLMLKKHLWAQACAQVAAKAEKTARCKPFATSEQKNRWYWREVLKHPSHSALRNRTNKTACKQHTSCKQQTVSRRLTRT